MLRIVHSRSPRSHSCDLWIDDDLAATTSKMVVQTLGLRDGDVVDTASLLISIQENEIPCARERALRLLGYRERSVYELTSRLLTDGYSQTAIDTVLARLSELDLVNDVRFARALIHDKHRAGWGSRRIREALCSAHIADSTIEYMMREEHPDDDLDRARAIASSADVSDYAQAQKLMAKLVRRGYDPSLARSVALDRFRESQSGAP